MEEEKEEKEDRKERGIEGGRNFLKLSLGRSWDAVWGLLCFFCSIQQTACESVCAK